MSRRHFSAKKIRSPLPCVLLVQTSFFYSLIDDCQLLNQQQEKRLLENTCYNQETWTKHHAAPTKGAAILLQWNHYPLLLSLYIKIKETFWSLKNCEVY